MGHGALPWFDLPSLLPPKDLCFSRQPGVQILCWNRSSLLIIQVYQRYRRMSSTQVLRPARSGRGYVQAAWRIVDISAAIRTVASFERHNITDYKKETRVWTG